MGCIPPTSFSWPPQTWAEGMKICVWAAASSPPWVELQAHLFSWLWLVNLHHGLPIGTPQTGLGVVAVTMASTAVWVCWDRFCWPGCSYLYQIRGCSGHENFLICGGNHWLHHLPELQYTLHQMARLTGDWQLGFLHLVLKGLHIGEGLQWLCKPVVSATKPQVWRQHELVFLQGWVGWWCTSNHAHTFHVNSWWSLWSGTSCSSCHQTSMTTCQACHCIHSSFCMGEGSGLLGVNICEKLLSTPALAGNIPFPLKSS